MMMSDPKKKVSTLILSKMAGEKEETKMAPEVDGIEQDASAGYDAAGEELVAALEAKDPKAAVSAIKSLIEMCMADVENTPAMPK